MSGYSAYWIGQIAKRYNTEGPAGMVNRRHTTSHRNRPAVPPAVQEELRQAVAEAAARHEYWSGREAAAWIGGRLGHPVTDHLGWRYLVRAQLRFVFRHFPLAQIHLHAEHAAEAAEAAGAQDAFWEMHDTLYEHQHALDDHHLVAYAVALSLDVPRFERDMAGHVYADRVREDFMSGVRSGVNGTPTFFINGRRHEGPYNLEPLLAALQGSMTTR